MREEVRKMRIKRYNFFGLAAIKRNKTTILKIVHGEERLLSILSIKTRKLVISGRQGGLSGQGGNVENCLYSCGFIGKWQRMSDLRKMRMVRIPLSPPENSSFRFVGLLSPRFRSFLEKSEHELFVFCSLFPSFKICLESCKKRCFQSLQRYRE